MFCCSHPFALSYKFYQQPIVSLIYGLCVLTSYLALFAKHSKFHPLPNPYYGRPGSTWFGTFIVAFIAHCFCLALLSPGTLTATLFCKHMNHSIFCGLWLYWTLCLFCYFTRFAPVFILLPSTLIQTSYSKQNLP